MFIYTMSSFQYLFIIILLFSSSFFMSRKDQVVSSHIFCTNCRAIRQWDSTYNMEKIGHNMCRRNPYSNNCCRCNCGSHCKLCLNHLRLNLKTKLLKNECFSHTIAAFPIGLACYGSQTFLVELAKHEIQ